MTYEDLNAIRVSVRITGDITIEDSFIENNSVGILASNGNVSLSNSLVSGNQQGIRITADTNLYINNESEVIGNAGEGISSYGTSDGTIVIEDSIIADNLGGGLITSDHDISVTDSVVENNAGDGIKGGTITLVRSLVSGNTIGLVGSAVIQQSTISGNASDGVNGGGDTIIVTDSTISDNGRIGIFGNFTNISVTQSTISGNAGGGIVSFSNLLTPISVSHSTIVDNHSTSGSFGGGIFSSFASISTEHSIISGNTFQGNASDLLIDDPDECVIFNCGYVPAISAAYSLISNNAGTNLVEAPVGSPDANGNLIGGAINGVIDPLLGPLQDNGGLTQTHGLPIGSPAIDAGDPAAVAGVGDTPLFDQRGQARVAGGIIDIGAYEKRQPLVVDSLLDESDGDFSAGDLSLREALELANATIGADIVMFDASLAGGSIVLTLGELAITDDLTLVGLGADLLTIDAQGGGDNELDGDGFRIFNVDDNDSFASHIEVSISGLTLTGGDVPDSAISSQGGAIRNAERLTVVGSEITGNRARFGGGLFNESGAELTVRDSTISGNIATVAGGGFSNYSQLTISNSTISGNEAASLGGGLDNFGSGIGFATLRLQNSTVAANVAPQASGISNSNAFSSATAILSNSIVVGAIDGTGSVNGAFNLFDGTVTINGTNNLFNTDPLLGPLADNGGPTRTHPLLSGSSAIDAGDPNAVAGDPNTPLFDQRGSGRIDEGRIDIGSFEVQVAPQVESIVVQDGSEQRSVIREITVNFDSIITADAGAFVLTNSAGQIVDVSAALSIVDGKTVAVLTFSGSFADASGSLIDGNYSLRVVDTMIHDLAGNAADADGDGTSGDDLTDDFFRLYGDADGDGSVGFLDLALFRSALFAMEGDKNFNIAFDANGDGVVNLLDIQAFRNNFGATNGK